MGWRRTTSSARAVAEEACGGSIAAALTAGAPWAPMAFPSLAATSASQVLTLLPNTGKPKKKKKKSVDKDVLWSVEVSDFFMEYRGEDGKTCALIQMVSWITLDFVIFILAINFLSTLCSLFVFAVDHGRARDQLFPEWLGVSAPPHLVVDWLFGWLLFFFLLGLLGLIITCCSFCCRSSGSPTDISYRAHLSSCVHLAFSHKLHSWHPLLSLQITAIATSSGATRPLGPVIRWVGLINHVPSWCLHRLILLLPPKEHHHHSNCANCDCGDCCSGGDCSGKNDVAHILLVILAVVVVILIILGIFVGAVLIAFFLKPCPYNFYLRDQVSFWPL